MQQHTRDHHPEPVERVRRTHDERQRTAAYLICSTALDEQGVADDRNAVADPADEAARRSHPDVGRQRRCAEADRHHPERSCICTRNADALDHVTAPPTADHETGADASVQQAVAEVAGVQHPGRKRQHQQRHQRGKHNRAGERGETSEQTALILLLLSERGVDFESLEYHVSGIEEDEFRELLRKAGVGPRELLRTREPLVGQLGLDGPGVSDEQLIEHPELVQRPIVVNGERALLARPIERVLELL